MSNAPVLELDNGDMCVKIAIRGAELQSLRHHGHEFIWQGG